MDEPGFLSSSRVAILGLGLMGGSLALALRGRCAGLLGVDPDPETLRLARERRVVDLASDDPQGLLPMADTIVLAAPVGAILNLIPTLPDLHPGPAFVIDLGSTKTRICLALERLPERFETVGGHPMCGKETLSLANADSQLYAGAPFALTPVAGTTRRARQAAEELAQAAGAHPLWMDPESHDRWVAATSHLPYLVANALAGATPVEAGALVGPGFRSTTRLSTTPTSMMLDILETNRANLLGSLGRFREGLAALEQSLADGDSSRLQELLEQGAARQREVLAGEFYGS
jgi:prephenate dehydrogenase